MIDLVQRTAGSTLPNSTQWSRSGGEDLLPYARPNAARHQARNRSGTRCRRRRQGPFADRRRPPHAPVSQSESTSSGTDWWYGRAALSADTGTMSTQSDPWKPLSKPSTGRLPGRSACPLFSFCTAAANRESCVLTITTLVSDDAKTARRARELRVVLNSKAAGDRPLFT